MISVTLALHLPQTEASDLMAKFKRVDWAGAIFLILTVFRVPHLVRSRQRWKRIVE